MLGTSLWRLARVSTGKKTFSSSNSIFPVIRDVSRGKKHWFWPLSQHIGLGIRIMIRNSAGRSAEACKKKWGPPNILKGEGVIMRCGSRYAGTFLDHEKTVPLPSVYYRLVRFREISNTSTEPTLVSGLQHSVPNSGRPGFHIVPPCLKLEIWTPEFCTEIS